MKKTKATADVNIDENGVSVKPNLSLTLGGKLHFKPLSKAPSLMYHQIVDGTKNEMRGGVGGILGGKYANGDFGNAPTQDASYGKGFSPTKMVNRGIMLSKKGGPVGGLARGAYLDAHGQGVMKPAVMPISEDAIRPIGMPKPRGMGFKKGSQEAKDHMAKIRAMRSKK